jgi:hypothetical protein
MEGIVEVVHRSASHTLRDLSGVWHNNDRADLPRTKALPIEFLMKKTYSLFSPLYPQHAVSARVCLPGRKSHSVTPLHRRNHRKSISTNLNLHPLAVLRLPKHQSLRYSAALQSP